jgi:hypothetical protein
MKKGKLHLLAAFLLSASAITVFTSCEKDEGKLPNIAFKTGSGYTSSDATVSKGDTVKVGITASKSEDKDVLKKFDASRSYDGGASSSFVSADLSGSDGDNYSRDVEIATRNQAGTEKYTFTVTNRDGLSNQVSLTLTVQ